MHTNGAAVAEAEMPAAGETAAVAGRPDAKTLEAIKAIRSRVISSVGQVVLAMMNLPRYRHQTLGDLMHILLDPLMRDRIAIANARTEEGKDETLAGIAIWASVSDAVDAKIGEQIKAGAFPIRLANKDWASGETVWLIDVIAPNRKLATAVLASFKQVAKDRPVKIHPIVARSVDQEVLEQMRVKPVGEAANGA